MKIPSLIDGLLKRRRDSPAASLRAANDTSARRGLCHAFDERSVGAEGLVACAAAGSEPLAAAGLGAAFRAAVQADRELPHAGRAGEAGPVDALAREQRA